MQEAGTPLFHPAAAATVFLARAAGSALTTAAVPYLSAIFYIIAAADINIAINSPLLSSCPLTAILAIRRAIVTDH